MTLFIFIITYIFYLYLAFIPYFQFVVHHKMFKTSPSNWIKKHLFSYTFILLQWAKVRITYWQYFKLLCIWFVWYELHVLYKIVYIYEIILSSIYWINAKYYLYYNHKILFILYLKCLHRRKSLYGVYS